MPKPDKQRKGGTRKKTRDISFVKENVSVNPVFRIISWDKNLESNMWYNDTPCESI